MPPLAPLAPLTPPHVRPPAGVRADEHAPLRDEALPRRARPRPQGRPLYLRANGDPHERPLRRPRARLVGRPRVAVAAAALVVARRRARALPA
eukprot:1082661-Prymnesium_polylepis.1